MNDEIDEINARNKELNEHKSEGDFSQAKNSKITHPDEDKKKMAEGIIAELQSLRQENDDFKKMFNDLAIRINELTNGINQLAQGQIQTPQGAPGQPQGMNLEALGQLGELGEKLVSAYKSLKGDAPGPAPLIDQKFINERMVKSFLDDLDTGTSITNFIKDSLKKKVTREVINTSLADMGKSNEHAPQ